MKRSRQQSSANNSHDLWAGLAPEQKQAHMLASLRVKDRVRNLFNLLAELYAVDFGKPYSVLASECKRANVPLGHSSVSACKDRLNVAIQALANDNPASMPEVPPYLFETQAALASWLGAFGRTSMLAPSHLSHFLDGALYRIDFLIAWFHRREPGGAGHQLAERVKELKAARLDLGKTWTKRPAATAAPATVTTRAAPTDAIATEPTPTRRHLEPRAERAWFQYNSVTSTSGVATMLDREAYDLLEQALSQAGRDGEIVPLPSFETWRRNLRIARKALGEQKHRPRHDRAHGSSIRRDRDI